MSKQTKKAKGDLSTYVSKRVFGGVRKMDPVKGKKAHDSVLRAMKRIQCAPTIHTSTTHLEKANEQDT